MPRPLGPAVSIVGGLVLGDAAITAGLASPATVLVVAYLVSLQSFGVPYMSPLAPMASGDLKDILIRAPLRALRIKPQSIRDGKPVR